MRLTDIAENAIHTIIARTLRRAMMLALVGAAVVVALYYASGAASLALTLQYGALQAYLIMAGIYAAVAAVALTVFYATRRRPVPQNVGGENIALNATGLLSMPRNVQIAMMIEAVMAGYTLARKSGKSIL